MQEPPRQKIFSLRGTLEKVGTPTARNCHIAKMIIRSKKKRCALLGVIGAVGFVPCSANPCLDAKYFAISGNELRIIVETAVRNRGIMADVPTTSSHAK